MRRPDLKSAMGMLLLSSAALTSCSDIDEYFEKPSWIGGSIYEELQGAGGYSLFLQGVDKAGYQPMVNGKSILTVMAPTDDAMRQYLKDNYGTESIDDVPADELKKLIGFHILYYSFDKEKLTNFRPNEGDGATDEEKNIRAGQYYKFRTRSQDAISYKNEATQDTAIYHFERLLPVFSYRLFQSKNIDAKANYEYFYPATGWQGDDGFNVGNAGVTSYADIANNGYVYKIDRVLSPTNTIYQEMKKSGKYTRFINMYDAYCTYTPDEDLTLEYGNGTTLYQRSYSGGLPNISSEWPATSYQQIAQMASQAYSVFAPTDQAWTDFFNDYWGFGGYESMDDVDTTAIQDILFNSFGHLKINGSDTYTMVFPEEIGNGQVYNTDNAVVSFDTEKVQDRVVCTNGVLYGCDVLTPPSKYLSVTGPANQYKKYRAMKLMLDNSGMNGTLASSAMSYIMLYASDEQIEQYRGLRRSGSQLIDVNTQAALNSSGMTAYVYAHVAAPGDGNTELPTTGTKVIPCLSPDVKLYWYLKDGKITNSIKHNELLRYAANQTQEADVWAGFEKLPYRGDVNGWSNGHAYSYDKNFFEGNYTNTNDSRLIRLMWQQRLDASTEFFGFINLLNVARFINTNTQALAQDLTADDVLMFIPTTTALEQAIKDGRVPGIDGSAATVGSETFFTDCTVTDLDRLQYYLRLYFVPQTTAVITNFPYVGWGEDTESLGGLITCQTDTYEADGNTEVVETKLNVYDEGARLTVGVADRATGAVSRRVAVSGAYDYFPFVFDDACAHFIDDVF